MIIILMNRKINNKILQYNKNLKSYFGRIKFKRFSNLSSAKNLKIYEIKIKLFNLKYFYYK